MQRVILHHYPNSPFAEKIRLILGSKRLHWASVLIPAVMPKPDVVALTGGYRKTPILQLGADIYCDTALIADVIETLAPEPSLYPAGVAPASRTLAQWADSTLFWAAIPYTLQPAGFAYMFRDAPPEAAKAFAEDRKSYRANIPRMRGPEAHAALCLYLDRLDAMLGDQSYFFGARPSIADFSVYHCLGSFRGLDPWQQSSNPSTASRLGASECAHRPWHYEILDSSAAIALAHASSPRTPLECTVSSTTSRPVKAWWSRPPTRARSPSKVRSTPRPRSHLDRARRWRAGRVVVHFPRLGFELRRAAAGKQ
jgi:glutathione S-transferase